MLNKGPAFWMAEPEYLGICAASSLAAFLLWPDAERSLGVSTDDEWFFWWDTLGVGAFAVIGAMNGVRAGVGPVSSALCGMMTATFGGMTRDVLCQRPPRILHSKAEWYASTAFGGAAAYVALLRAGAPAPVRIGTGVATAVALRWYAHTHDARLPLYPGLRDAPPR